MASSLIELERLDPGQEPAESRLGGSRILPLRIAPDSQRTSLGLTHATSKFFQIRLTPRRFAEQGQQNECCQAEQRIRFDPLPVFGQLFEVFNNGANFLHPARASRSHFELHDRQLRCEMLCLQMTATVPLERAHE